MEEEVALVRPSVAVMRAGFAQLDSWDLRDLFRQCGCLLKSVPRFLWGSIRICLKIALEEILAGARRRNVLQQERGWTSWAGTSWWSGSTNSQQESGTI